MRRRFSRLQENARSAVRATHTHTYPDPLPPPSSFFFVNNMTHTRLEDLPRGDKRGYYNSSSSTSLDATDHKRHVSASSWPNRAPPPVYRVGAGTQPAQTTDSSARAPSFGEATYLHCLCVRCFYTTSIWISFRQRILTRYATLSSSTFVLSYSSNMN